MSVLLLAALFAAVPAAAVADTEVPAPLDGNHPWGVSAAMGPRLALDGSEPLLDVTVALQWRGWRRGALEVSLVAPLSGRAHRSSDTESGLSESTQLYALELAPSVRGGVWAARRWLLYGDVGLGLGLLSLEQLSTFQGGTVQVSAFGVARLAIGLQLSLSERFFVDLQPAELRLAFGSDSGAAYLARLGVGVRL